MNSLYVKHLIANLLAVKVS